MERAERMRRAAPATDRRAAPATDRRAAPATDRRAAPATDRRPVPRPLVVQAKLQVGPVDDGYEREADAVADQVVRALRGPGPAPETDAADRSCRVRRRSSGEATDPVTAAVEPDAPTRIRRRAEAGVGPGGGALDQDTESRIQASRGGGRAMPAEVRGPMESAFAADFSRVRVHTGAQSSDLNNRIQAKAFTVGNDIHFRDGLPDTSTSAGQHLLAHELTHTIQQSGSVSRIARRTAAGAVGVRVQPTRIAISSRASGPVVQRVGEARAASLVVSGLVDKAKELRTMAEATGTTLAQLAQYKIDVDALLVDADREIAKGAKDKDGAAFNQQMKTFRIQIVAAQSRIAHPEVAAGGSLTAINSTLAAFGGSMSRRADEAQVHVQAAIAGMKSARETGLPKRATTAATKSKEAATELGKVCTDFAKESSDTMAQVDTWVLAAQASHLTGGAADRAKAKLQQSITLMTSILQLQKGDADVAAERAATMAAAVTRFIDAGEVKKAKEAAQKQREEAATEADKVVAAADAHATKCADEAAAASKLADEAVAAAVEAEQAASGADAMAGRAEAAAQSGQKSMAFYAKHLGGAPSAEAGAMVEQRRVEADQATQTAKDRRAESDALAIAATDARAASTPLEADAKAKSTSSREAREAHTKAAGEQTSAHQAKGTADRELGEATAEQDAARVGGTAAKDSTIAHGSKLAALAAAVPDANLRAQIRIAYGDAEAQTLLGKGIDVQLLLSGAATIKAMSARWTPADAGDVVKRLQDLGGSTHLVAFHTNAAKDVTARRALDLLDGAGDDIAWFIVTGVASANRLLDRGWPATDVKTLLTAAEKNAKLGPAQLTTFVALVEKITMPVATAEKLLKAGATASFLVDHALSSIEKLLAVPWDVDKLVTLVKSANDQCKPTKAEFEKFCKLVADNAVSVDNAVKVMQGANCTGAYLVDTAFLPVRDAVVDNWTTDQVKAFVKAAETKAVLDKAQIERFYKLVHDNTFTPDNVKACLTSTGVADWTFLMNRVDDFIADGNKGTPAVSNAAATSHTFGGPGNPVRIDIQAARVQHFVEGHAYKYYAFTQANIYRGGGAQPSSMWPRGKTAGQIRADALAAIQTAGVQALATRACAGNGSGGSFDQDDFGGYVAGIQAFDTNTTLMQFFPNGTAVAPDTMRAIGRLFRGAI